VDTGRLDTGRVDTGRVDTGRVDTGRVDTGRVDTGRPPDPLDGRMSAWRTADSATDGVAGVRTSWAATTAAAAGWAAQTSLGLQRLRRSATDDGCAVTTPAAVMTGQLRSTARHEAAPRRTAVLTGKQTDFA
jgi:hypothetical protein